MRVKVRIGPRGGAHEVLLDLVREDDDDGEHDRLMRALADIAGVTVSDRHVIERLSLPFRYPARASADAFASDLCALFRAGDA